MSINVDTPKVTVIMTVYNAPLFLRQALFSVVKQTYKNWELIVMEDGSTDCPQMIRSTIANFWVDAGKKMIVCSANPTPEERTKTVRYALNINRAFEMSSGDYITYLCGDDWYEPDRLERMVTLLRQGNHVVYGAQNLFYPDVDQSVRAPHAIRQTLGILEDPYGLVDLNSVMHTRESFEAAGGWPTDPTEATWRLADAYFWRRLCAAGYRFVPVLGHPTDNKRYRKDSVDQRVIDGKEPWT